MSLTSDVPVSHPPFLRCLWPENWPWVVPEGFLSVSSSSLNVSPFKNFIFKNVSDSVSLSLDSLEHIDIVSHREWAAVMEVYFLLQLKASTWDYGTIRLTDPLKWRLKCNKLGVFGFRSVLGVCFFFFWIWGRKRKAFCRNPLIIWVKKMLSYKRLIHHYKTSN